MVRGGLRVVVAFDCLSEWDGIGTEERLTEVVLSDWLIRDDLRAVVEL